MQMRNATMVNPRDGTGVDYSYMGWGKVVKGFTQNSRGDCAQAVRKARKKNPFLNAEFYAKHNHDARLVG